jgi:putative transposase
MFGTVYPGEPPTVTLSGLGLLTRSEWLRSQHVRPALTLDVFVIMPNHLHAIVWLDGSCSAKAPEATRCFRRAPQSLGSVIAGFKASVRRCARDAGIAASDVFWQRNYFERAIQDNRELDVFRKYIEVNPRRWLLRL